ncbi:MAG: hypothetical protein OEY97_06925 [Nitrospirota bacterium]|nr:hypothetical protein [Nitrospirota bacterium]
MADSDRYVKLPDGSIVDTAPAKEWGDPLVLQGGKWVTFTGNMGDLLEATPISEDEANGLPG